MNNKGTDIWCHICDSITEDDDYNMVDPVNTKTYEQGSGGQSTDFVFMTPYKKISEQGLALVEKAFVKIAAEVATGNSVDEIRVTPLTYHFFKQETLDAFLSRLHDLIEDSGL